MFIKTPNPHFQGETNLSSHIHSFTGKEYEKIPWRGANPLILKECECGVARFTDTGIILTAKGKVKFLTATMVLEEGDFEV